MANQIRAIFDPFLKDAGTCKCKDACTFFFWFYKKYLYIIGMTTMLF